MDNTGAYLSYEEFILELFVGGSTKIVKKDITLSAKVVDAGGDIYAYTGVATPIIGSVIIQNGNTGVVIEMLTGPNRIRVNKTGVANKLVNGPAKEVQSETISQPVVEGWIADAMAKIDELTGQFFNKREGTWSIPGNNTMTLWFQVPIIEIEELLINSTDIGLTEGESYDFVAFKSRSRPRDDRKNPRIQLNVGKGRDSVFVNSLTSRLFVKNTLTKITGAFGYLEPDGSTPRPIKKATMLLAVEAMNANPGADVGQFAGVGPMKRLKVDLHEQEFFESTSNKATIASSKTGIPEVDRIIAMYKSPIKIGGSFMSRRSDSYNTDDYSPI